MEPPSGETRPARDVPCEANVGEDDDDSSDTMQQSILSIGSMGSMTVATDYNESHRAAPTLRGDDFDPNAVGTPSMPRSDVHASTPSPRNPDRALPQPPTNIITQHLAPHDVVWNGGDGDGTDWDGHVGNQSYRANVQKRQGPFAAATSDKAKRAIRRDLIQTVKSQGGRFWKVKVAGDGTQTRWNEVRDKALNTQVEHDLSHVRLYIEGPVTDVDYLVGRGGHNIRHKGNQAYLDQKDKLQDAYRQAQSRNEKHQISKELVHWVHERGGRFLKRDETKQWYIISNDLAYKQARQKLTEPRKKPAIRTNVSQPNAR